MQLPTLESGTSVAPRQRPTVQRNKGNTQPSQLPIVAPPSPSPRNNLSSPVPPSLTQVDASSHPVCDQFTAQFTANFPATTPNPVTGSNVQPQQQLATPKLTNLPTTNATTQSFDGDNSDKLFEFSDPFNEADNDKCIPTEPLDSVPVDNGNVVETQKIGHRRNMSDTSAFNK